jgi:hypothetical protein
MPPRDDFVLRHWLAPDGWQQRQDSPLFGFREHYRFTDISGMFVGVFIWRLTIPKAPAQDAPQ